MANRRISNENRAAILDALNNGATYREIATKYRISQPTIARIKREGTNPPEAQNEPAPRVQPPTRTEPQTQGQGETFTLKEEAPTPRRTTQKPQPEPQTPRRERYFLL